MRDFPGWAIGAAGVGALVGAFYLGGRTSAAPSDIHTTPAASLAAVSTDVSGRGDLAVTCEPGQRAEVRAAAAGGAPQVACVSDARPIAPIGSPVAYATYEAPVAAAPAVVRVANTSGPYAQPAVITQPTEVYRPRARSASSRSSGEVAPPVRSVKKSVAIIAGSTAAGAVVGGLVKGKKGAVVGGVLGGGAATVWDQVTRRRNDDIR